MNCYKKQQPSSNRETRIMHEFWTQWNCICAYLLANSMIEMAKINLRCGLHLLLSTHFRHTYIVSLIWKLKKHIKWLFDHVVTSQSVHSVNLFLFLLPIDLFCNVHVWTTPQILTCVLQYYIEQVLCPYMFVSRNCILIRWPHF